jgi:hypothetical protein
MISKKGDFNFVWLFAIIAGTAFLILAIFFALKIGGTLKTTGDTEIAKSLEAIVDPLQAGFVDGKTTSITFAVNTQINLVCDDTEFGSEMLSVITESDLRRKNPPTPIEVRIPNKYIFAQEDVGKKYYVFSKKFELGFPVADILFISTGQYCLVNPPERIKSEIMGLNPPNIKVKDQINNTCSDDSIQVCFKYGDDCNMTVYANCYGSNCVDEFETGTITKGSESTKFFGDLIYGAIFSEKELYECNVKRLLYRTSQIATVYTEKADLLDARGCGTNLNSDLSSFSQLTADANVDNLPNLFLAGKVLAQKSQQEKGGCGVW